MLFQGMFFVVLYVSAYFYQWNLSNQKISIVHKILTYTSGITKIPKVVRYASVMNKIPLRSPLKLLDACKIYQSHGNLFHYGNYLPSMILRDR